MRRAWFAVAVLAVSCLFSGAQQAKPAGWASVEALAAGTSIRVAMKAEKVTCKLKSVTEEAIVCVSGGNAQSYPRAEIRSVKIPHRGRSTLAGLAIGAAAGAVIGAPFGKSGSFVGHGAAALILGVPGALIGAIVGACTDFTHSTTYKAS